MNVLYGKSEATERTVEKSQKFGPSCQDASLYNGSAATRPLGGAGGVAGECLTFMGIFLDFDMDDRKERSDN